MKGTIVTCLREMVIEARGQGAWRSILHKAGMDESAIFMLNQDVDEEQSTALFQAAAVVLSLSWPELCDRFGRHWCVAYAPKIYKAFYNRHKTARDFLLDINELHARMTASIPNARPPRFKLAQVPGSRSLLVTYESPRGLVDLAIGLARGMGEYFNEHLSVTKVSGGQFRVDFG